MPSIQEQIKEIEDEYARTQKNKATEGHLGRLKAKLAKLRRQLDEPDSKTSSSHEGFEVARYGNGKSSLLRQLTGTQTEIAEYAFTTLSCIPGVLTYNGAKVQVLDLPGIIQGAAEGKGRGRQVVSVAKSADVVLMVLDATKELDNRHTEILSSELEQIGMRLNKLPPDVTVRRRRTGGVSMTSTVALTELTNEVVERVCYEYKMHNAEVLIREDISVDQLIDVIEGNRRYVTCFYVYNKVDLITLEEAERIGRTSRCIPLSCELELGTEYLLKCVWHAMNLRRVYTKPQGAKPDFDEPVLLGSNRGGHTVEALCHQVHSSLVDEIAYANVYGRSVKFSPQRVGLQHELADEDVVEIKKKTTKEQNVSRTTENAAKQKVKKPLST